LASARDSTGPLAVDSTNVYWWEFDDTQSAGVIREVPLTGGTPTTLVSASSGVEAIALDAANIYWVDAYGKIMKAPLSGGTSTVLATLAADDLHSSLAVDATNVYWMRGGTVASVMKVAK